MNIDFTKLEKKIGFKFKDQELLIKSMTHKSYNSIENYEKLEFLGDRVLGFVISKKLLELFPNEKVGILDKKFASLVNKKKCLEIALSINLEKFIQISKSKKNDSKIEDKIVADCCEGLLAAIYLEKGFNFTENFILKLWKNHLNASVFTFVDPKTKLQEYSLKKFKKLPTYKLLQNTGPRHKPIFKIAVKLENSKFFNATGNSKKDAEQKAASLLLAFINNK